MHALCVISNIITHQKMIYKDFIRIASKKHTRDEHLQNCTYLSEFAIYEKGDAYHYHCYLTINHSAWISNS